MGLLLVPKHTAHTLPSEPPKLHMSMVVTTMIDPVRVFVKSSRPLVTSVAAKRRTSW
jgi:hypothetical protein